MCDVLHIYNTGYNKNHWKQTIKYKSAYSLKKKKHESEILYKLFNVICKLNNWKCPKFRNVLFNSTELFQNKIQQMRIKEEVEFSQNIISPSKKMLSKGCKKCATARKEAVFFP